ncbi:MAG: HDOD domain-containing protein, partial [Desulfovibrionales bacterium]
MRFLSNSDYPVKADTPARIKGLLKKIEEIPSPPAAALQALELIMEEDVDIERLSTVIESDPAMTLKLLKLVNAVGNGLVQEVKSIRQSISLLGLNTIRFSILGVLIRDFLPGANSAEDFEDIWTHGLACAVAAQLIAEKSYPSLKYEVFTIGMLHDIGKIFFIEFLPDQYDRICRYQSLHKVGMIEAEQETLGTNHTRIGKWIAEKWSLPDPLIRAIWLHHNPPDTLEILKEDRESVSIVMLADILAHEHFSPLENADIHWDKEHLMEQLALTGEEIEEICSMLSIRFAERAGLFALEGDLNRIYFQSLSNANQKLSAMALELENRNLTLTKINRISRINVELALAIASASSYESMLSELARTYMRSERFQFGASYIIDLEQRLLEGIIWHRDRKKKFICFLNKDGTPVWDHKTQKIPDGFKKIISSYEKRLGVDHPEKESFDSFLSFKPSFRLIPVFSDPSMHCEFCISLQGGNHEISEEEKLGLLHTANLIAAGIRRIQLTDKLETRSEELNLALWRNQQINLKILQTERLAAVGQLAAGSAHEINNPLAIINARAQLLQRKEKDEKKQQELKQITDQIERISGILTDLMTFARPSPPKLNQVEIPALLDKVLDLVKGGLDKNKIAVVRKYADQLPRIKADHNQLEQVFLNLILNAQHAMENTGGDLTVSTDVSEDGQYVILSISDQGHGISRKHLA